MQEDLERLQNRFQTLKDQTLDDFLRIASRYTVQKSDIDNEYARIQAEEKSEEKVDKQEENV